MHACVWNFVCECMYVRVCVFVSVNRYLCDATAATKYMQEKAKVQEMIIISKTTIRLQLIAVTPIYMKASKVYKSIKA